METPTVVGSAVIDAVVGSAAGYKRAYEMWAGMASDSMRNATEAHESAAESREKLEQCIRFLDDTAPGWKDAIPKERRWAIFGKTAEEVAEEEAAKALVEPPTTPETAQQDDDFALEA